MVTLIVDWIPDCAYKQLFNEDFVLCQESFDRNFFSSLGGIPNKQAPWECNQRKWGKIDAPALQAHTVPCTFGGKYAEVFNQR